MANEAFTLFDILVFGKILPNHTEEDLNSIRESALADRDDLRHRQFIYEMMNALDAKTSALLTHISLIIAALTFLYTARTSGSWFRLVVMFELCCYLLLTIFCLRSIRMTSRLTGGVPSTESRGLEIELWKRRTVYNFASNSTVLVTVFMLITLVFGALCASS
ncbi:MAG: hypothetical protein QOC72_629 [Methylobacteriaceae bacterium]|jgi:hypothetical protein|nr:hypothetical protein [Methylobacteriaceae bacterium]